MSALKIPWLVILDKPRTGSENMAVDIEMFEHCDSPNVRIYSWKNKCISYGYAQKINDLIDVGKAAKDGWEIVKRPTGGGIVYHIPDEVTYSVACPINSLPEGLMGSYFYISEIIVKALRSLGVDARLGSRVKGQDGLCFSSTREYEISVNGKKLVGSAQKRGRSAMLQQGSIQFPEICLKKQPSYDEIASAIKSAFEG